MIDSRNITNYYRTISELQEFWLFCFFVAGKQSKRVEKITNDFIYKSKLHVHGNTPFQTINKMIDDDVLLWELQRARTGKYNTYLKTIPQSLDLDLQTATCEELEEIYGVGPKTSRFFILHSRKNQNLAVLDTHILKYLSKLYPNLKIPKQTPNKKHYKNLENLFLKEAEKQNIKPASLDMLIWKGYAK